MLTLEQSGLTLDQYNALAIADSGATWSLTAHKYNLNFSEVGADQGRDNDTPDFDAVACGDFIYRSVADSLLERFDAITFTWSQVTAFTGFDSASSIDTDGSQLVCDGDNLFIYVAETSGIWQSYTSDDGDSWSAWTQVTADENINKIAAVNKDRIHYTVMDVDKNIYNMRVAKYDGSWSSTDSDIWYTYPFSNFTAAELPDGSDMIVAATQVPGITTVKLVVNVVTKYIKQQGGIIGFKYSNDTWGDHYDIDVVDDLTAYRFRDRIKLTQFSDRVALTCYSSDGTQLFPYTMYRIYTTTDGKYWSKGNALPLPESPGSSGIKLCQLGDYVYAIEKSRAYKSLMTLYLGYSPPAAQLEIPKHYISSLSLSEGEMMQGSATLSNEDGWLNDNSILTKNGRTLLFLRMGYFIDGESVKVQTNIGEVDTYDNSTSLPRKMVKLTFRDFQSWMTDINAAERPYYWDSQLLAGDNFVDTTNDKYGGLRHLEPQSGSFTSEDSNLNLTSNNEEGVGFSTFSLYLWNGITQSQFTLATVANSEYAGVVFRGVDKDNIWIAVYQQSTDKIELRERSGGSGELKASSGTKSWASTPTTPRYIQVEFRYARIIVRSSDDGITWTDEINYLMSMIEPTLTPELIPLANSNKERGYVGFLGKGYAPPEVTAWPTDPEPYTDPPYYPFEPPYFPPYDTNYPGPYIPVVTGPTTSTAPLGSGTGTYPHKVLMCSEFGQVFKSTNLNANTGEITWHLIHDFNANIHAVKRDPFNARQYYFATDDGLYRIPNVFATTPLATLVANNYTLFTDPDIYPNGIYMSENKKGWIGVNGSGGFTFMSGGHMDDGPLVGGAVFATTFNSGAAWTHTDVNTGGGNNGAQLAPWSYAVPYKSTGIIYVAFASANFFFTQSNLYRSADWGLTWSSINNAFYESGSNPQIIYSPYRRSTTPYALNAINASHELIVIGSSSGDHPGFLRSTDAGATWEDFYALADPPVFATGFLAQASDYNLPIYASNARNGKVNITERNHIGGTGYSGYYNVDDGIVLESPELNPSGSHLVELIYTTNGWITASLIPSALFHEFSFLTPWVANVKFLVVSCRSMSPTSVNQAITEDASLNGQMVVTSDWIHWYNILPPIGLDGITSVYPIYVDVQ